MCTDQGRVRRSEGTEANNFNAVWGGWSGARNLSRESSAPLGIAGAPSHWPMAFALETRCLDSHSFLNCVVRAKLIRNKAGARSA